MRIDISELMNSGNATTIKGKQFLDTKAYVEPFCNLLNNLNPSFNCEVDIANQISYTNNTPNVVYNRVSVQAILPQSFYFQNNCRKVLGMVYGLDCKPATVKFYIADIDDRDRIFSFNPLCKIEQELEENNPIDFTNLQSLFTITDLNPTIYSSLITAVIDRNDMITKLGEWIDFSLSNYQSTVNGKVKLATSFPINIYKNLIVDANSPFYIPINHNLTMLQIYNVGLQIISTEKDILNTFDKIMLLNKMLKI